jgi:hypothetical protein
MGTPAGICHGCQTIVDKMASATVRKVRNSNPFEPAFFLTGLETTPCSLCSLLENTANAHGYSTSDECHRRAYTWTQGAIFCKSPRGSMIFEFRQLSGKYAKITAPLLWR